MSNPVMLRKVDSKAPQAVTFGWELILDLYDCDVKKISSEEAIRNYARELCDVIRMIPYGEPMTP